MYVPGVPVAAIGEVGVPSVSGGYRAEVVLGYRIYTMRQGICQGSLKDVPLLGERFSASYHLLLLARYVPNVAKRST